jgi:hypothetical protein
MSKYSVGGWVERSAVPFFNSFFLFSLFRAWHLRREPVLTLRWMTRAIAVLLGIATTRPVMGHSSPPVGSPIFHMSSSLVSRSGLVSRSTH